MEATKAAPTILHLFECSGKEKHRIYRRDDANKASCSRCCSSFRFIVKLDRNDDETDVQHAIRILAYRKPRVN